MFFPGTAGTPGSVWRIGTTIPTTAIGIDGDFFIVTPTGDIYTKVAGNYVLSGNIRGPVGATGAASTVAGPQGPAGPTGPQGPEASVQGAMLYLNTTMTVPTASDTDVVWSGAYYDDLGFWSASLPDRFVIPANVSRIRLTVGIRWNDSTAGNRKVRVRGNPAGAFEANAIWACSEHPTGAQGDCTLSTGIIPVVEGDYFNVPVTQDSGGDLDLRITPASSARGNFFCLEVIA